MGTVGGPPHALRVALLGGQLTYGGAQKQLVYMARALHEAGVVVRLYTLNEGAFYDTALRDAGLEVIRVARARNPALRLVSLVQALRRFRPHVVQAAQFYLNLYVALAARACGAVAIGAIRGDGVRDVQNAGLWGSLLLHAPVALVTNSHRARAMAAERGISAADIHVIPNVVETEAFDRALHLCSRRRGASPPMVILVAQLIAAKRVDRFLDGFALARRSVPGLRGVVVGEGPERPFLQEYAASLGLFPVALEFRGVSSDVPGLMAEADILALTSDHEGLPNVILEAMAARLPVITTPAGDAATVVEDGVSGFVIPFDAVGQLGDRLTRLAQTPALCRKLGEAGYARVRARYAFAGLAERLFVVYSAVRGRGRHPGARDPSRGNDRATMGMNAQRNASR